MRRNEKAITDNSELEAIIRRSHVCRVAMCDGVQPYIVPMCFGLLDGKLYFHAATEGRKLDILRINQRVCVEFDIDQEIVMAPVSCNIAMRYRSVIGFGTAVIVEDAEEKRIGLEAVVLQYVKECTPFPAEMLERTMVIRVALEEMTGKKSGY
ncbi:MAG: pyridoxamine 5'-phosphate oxidase family protein [Armatimonadota bacterium]